MRIRKKYQVIPTNAKLENGHSTSDKNGYTAEYINGAIAGETLWENSSTTSNFAAQTINLIENDYTEYDLYYKINKDLDYMKVERLVVGQKGVLVVPAIEGFFGYVVNRNITSITNSAITFGTGRMNNTDHNENMIPVKVVGIK